MDHHDDETVADMEEVELSTSHKSPAAPAVATSSSTDNNAPSSVVPSHSHVWHELRTNPRLLLVVLFACVGGLLFGYDTGIIGGVTSLDDFRMQFSIALPINGVDTNYTASEIAWIVSSFLLAAAAGAIITGPIADIISRRWSIFWGAVLFTIGGILQAAAYGLPQLIIGRVVAGFAVGILSCIIPVYNAEVSSPAVRGICNTLFQLSITVGILIAFLLNLGFQHIHPYGWRLSLAIQSVFSLVLVFGIMFLPESPRFLMVKRREPEALKVLERLRNNQPVDPAQAEFAIAQAAIGSSGAPTVDGNARHVVEFKTFNRPVPRTAENAQQWNVVKLPSNTIEQEIEEIRASILHQEAIGEVSWADIFRTELRCRVAVGCGVQGWQQLTGLNAIIYYSSTIFANVGINSLVSTAIVGIINVVATIITLPIVDRAGRVPLLLFGAIGMALCSLIVGVVGLYGTSGAYGTSLVVFTCLYVANFAYSWGPCGWIVPSEIFPLSARAKGVSLTTAVNWLGNFGISQATPHLLATAGVGPTFLLFFGLLCVITVFVFTMVPETRGVSLEQMDHIFAVQNASQFAQYVRFNFRHCLHLLTCGLVQDNLLEAVHRQRELNYLQNKEAKQDNHIDSPQQKSVDPPSTTYAAANQEAI